MFLRFVTLMLTVLTLLVATCAPVHLDTLEMEPHVLVRVVLAYSTYNGMFRMRASEQSLLPLYYPPGSQHYLCTFSPLVQYLVFLQACMVIFGEVFNYAVTCHM